jgi:hypothetical protein
MYKSINIKYISKKKIPIFSLISSITLILNIITTNKNKTAIAPAYTIIKIKPKNSKFKNRIKNKPKIIKKQIKYKIVYIGFFDKIIPNVNNNNNNKNQTIITNSKKPIQ